MNYPEFIKYLKSKNIILFDHDYRIAYNNINSYMISTKENDIMTGGGNRIQQYSDITLKHIIDTALSPEPNKLYNFI
jgi:hypothetical protein